MDDDDERLRRESAASNGDEDVERLLLAPEVTGEPTDVAMDGAPLQADTVQHNEASANAADNPEDAIVDEREVLFLIANYLEKRDEFKQAAQALIGDLSTSDLMGESVAWNGQAKPATYADYKRRHRDLGPNHLLHILQGALTAKPAATRKAGNHDRANVNVNASTSLLLKSRVTSHRKMLTPPERKALQTEVINKTMQLRRLHRTEALVTRVVRKFDRLLQFLEDAQLESLPADVRQALAASSVASVNVTALAADVRAVKQLLQVRDEKTALHKALYLLLERAKDTGAMQSTARTGRNHLSLLHRREISMHAPSREPPTHIYSRIRRLKTLNGHLQIPTYCMTYDKTGKFVITGADDRLIKIWSLHTGDLRFTLRGHVGNITDLAVNWSNTLLASSSDDKTVRVWELSTGAPVAVLLGHSSVVNSVRFHPSKNIVVTASDDGHCFCYRLPDIAKFGDVESKEQTAKRLLDQGAYLLTLRPAYSLSHSQNRPNVRSNKVLCLNFSRCGNYVVTGGQDGLGRVWDVSELCDANNQVAATDFQVGPQDTLRVISPPTAVDSTGAPTQDTVEPPAEIAIDPAQVEGEQMAVEDAPVTIVDATTPPPNENVLLPSPQFPLPIPLAVQNPVQAAEVRQQPQLPEVHQSRQAVVDIEQVHVIADPIAFLKGHTGPVTNILFSHRGDKIATASIKDGTTRVWQWEKKYKKVTNKVLLDQEHDRNRELELLYGISSRKRMPPAVDTLVWTHDDQRLITLHSTKPDSGTGEGDWRQRMRIWDPVTGKLEMTLAALDREKKHGHVNAVFAMDVHPTDWRIVVTAGHDGRVFLWDISEGRILKSFVVTSPEGETIALLDGSFMPTGEGFCFTDRIGRLCIFGTGSGEHLAAVPVQQYFHSDYAALITDRHFHVIDRETQRAPSLMESGPLDDIFLVEYPHQPPQLLASRGAMTKEQYEENRRKRVQQCLESETMCKVRHNAQDEDLVEDDDFPVAILRPPTDDVDETTGNGMPPQLADGAYRLNGDAVFQAELLRRASWNRRRRVEQQTRRRASATSDERDTSILNVDISSEDDHSDEDFQVPQQRRAGEDDDDDDDEEEDEEDDEDSELDEDDVPSDTSDAPEGDRLRRRRARQTERQFSGRGRRLDSNNDEDIENENRNGEGTGRRLRRRLVVPRPRLIGDEEDEHMDGPSAAGIWPPHRRSRSQSIGSNESAADAVVVESNDGFIMGDNTLDKFDTSMTYETMLAAKRIQLPAGSDITSALIVCSFCGEGDDGGFLKLPGDALGKHPLVSGTQRLFVHDQCAIASPLCFNRGGRWYNVTKEIRRGRSLSCVQCKKRGATVGCMLERCPKSYHWKCALGCGWTMDQIQFYCPEHAPRARGQGGASDGGVDAEMQQRLGLTFHREWLQLPSLVGIHTYVPQTGDHVLYFPEGHVEFLDATTMKEPAFRRQLSRFVSLKCRVVDVKYRFPSLAVYHHPKQKQKAIHCEVTLAILAVPTAVFPDLQPAEEEKEELDGTNVFNPDTTTLFLPEAPFFSKFTGVNQFLQPTTAHACERMQIKLTTFSNDISNFIVLDHVFDAGISGNWKVGQRVRTPIVDLDQGLQTSSKMSFGTIEAILARKSDANPSVITPWNSVFVRWDANDEDDCSVSPWELEPATAMETMSKKERERNLQSVKLYTSRMLSQAQQLALSEALASVMAMDFAKDFVYPVSSEYVDYMVTVANPIDLTKIRARVTNGYYRQLDAFIADVELLQENCQTYNVSTSPIAHNARSVTSSILTTLQQFHPEFFANREDTNSTVRHYPPIDFGSNDDDVVDIDEASFEEEQRIDDAMTALDGLPTLLSDPEPVDSPQRPTRSTRAAAVMEVMTTNSGIDSPRPTRRSTAAATVTATATPERRSRRDAQPTIVSSPELPTKQSARKRPRLSDTPRLLKFADLMNCLTAEQRQLFEVRAADDLLSLLRDFHEALMGADIYDVFGHPVSEDIAPGYHDVIQNPMDFGTILDAIEKYARFSRYFGDVELVFANAIAYNTWESDIGVVVKELQEYSVKFLLDAIGANAKRKPKPRGRLGHLPATVLDTPSRSKANGTLKRKRRAVSDEEEDDEDADSWASDTSGSNDEEDEDEEDEDEDEEDDEEDDASDGLSEPESDWSGGGRGRRKRLVRGDARKTNKPTKGKKFKKENKKAIHKKRGRPSRG